MHSMKLLCADKQCAEAGGHPARPTFCCRLRNLHLAWVVSLTEDPLPCTPRFPLQHFLRQLRDLPLAAEQGLPITQQVRVRSARCAAACAVVALGTRLHCSARSHHRAAGGVLVTCPDVSFNCVAARRTTRRCRRR